MKKRILSLALALTFCTSLFSIAATASQEGEPPPEAAFPLPGEDGVITLEEDLVLSTTWVIEDTVTLNLNGYTVSSGENDIWDDSEGVKTWSLISVRGAAGSLTINDDGGGETTGTLQTKENDCYAVDVRDGAACTINGGKYVGNIHAVYVHDGTLRVTGGEFSVQQIYSEDKPYQFTLNCLDANYQNGTASISVSGGRFYQFDPGNNQAEGEGTSFLAEGCLSAADGDYYTVTPAAAQIGDAYYPSLAAAVEAAEDGGEIKLLKNSAGSGIGLFADTEDKCPVKKLTIDFQTYTYTMDNTPVGSPGTESQSMHFEKGSDITLKNGTLEVAAGGMGIQNYGNLKLIDFHVDASMNSNCQYVSSNNCGVVEISGNSSITAAEGQVAFDLYYWPSYGYEEGVSVTVKGGSVIKGDIEYSSDGTEAGLRDIGEKALLRIEGGTFEGGLITSGLGEGVKPNISITGGTFAFDPSKVPVAEGSEETVSFVASGYRVSESGGKWTVSRVPSSSGGGSYTPPTTTTTHRNEDGSVTTTVTNNRTGTVTATTKAPDGSSTVVETQKDGTVTTTVTTADGSTATTVAKPDGSSQTDIQQADGTTATVVTDTKGNTLTQVELSDKAVTAAQKSGEAVVLPIPAVEAGQDAEAAPTVEVLVPKNAKPVPVEIPVTDVTPGTVAVIVHADGTEEIVKTSLPTGSGVVLTLDGSATVKIVDNTQPFDDLARGHWAKDSVDFVAARELFQGTADKTFDPDLSMTRGMLLTVLARLENVEAANRESWYGGALKWAVETGISDGSNPEHPITREQLATMLYRYAGAPAAAGNLAAFPDGGSVASYAQAAMEWAVKSGIINGKWNGTLDPQGQATRAEVAAMIQRYITLG